MSNIKMLVMPFVLGLIISSLAFATPAGETVLFNFENNNKEGWGIPEWTAQKPEYIGQAISVSNKYASKGKSSLEVEANFPGGLWTAAYVEIADYYDWAPYNTISVDLYIPESAPKGLRARVVLTVSDNWEWVESVQAVPLIPGKWVTITANLKPGSVDWKTAEINDAFRKDVRKLGVRIESNMKPAYKGAIYLDNVQLK